MNECEASTSDIFWSWCNSFLQVSVKRQETQEEQWGRGTKAILGVWLQWTQLRNPKTPPEVTEDLTPTGIWTFLLGLASQTCLYKQVDRKKKPDSQKKTRSEQDDGYEPVGKAPLNMETWIAEKNNEFNAIMVSDADTRNINRKAKKESKIATVPHVNLEVVGGNKGNEMENVELIHLQRSLSEKSFKSNSSEKSSSKEKKRIKEEEKEKERLAKQEEKRRKKEEKKMEEMAKATKLKEMKRLKMEEKEQKRKEEAEIKKLQKQEEEKLKQRQDEEKRKRVEEEKKEKREKERQLEEERRAKLEKDKMERLKKEEEEKALQKKQEEEKIRMKEQKEEEKRKQKQLEEQRKQMREKEKQEEKERKALAKIEKERQAKELKALMDAQKAEKDVPETDLDYADEEDTRATSSVRHPTVIEEEEEPPGTPDIKGSSMWVDLQLFF